MSRRKKADGMAPGGGAAVYCGPDLPGLLRQYTVITGALPPALEEMFRECPALRRLLVTLDEFPEARRQLSSGTGPMCALYRQVRNTLQGGK